jgi:parallel beta-helix repeat protein
MRRFALAILLMTAATAAVFLALNRPGAQASPGAIITVDDTGDTNTRDDHITLQEAMLLATGTLAVGDLNSSECLLVSNTSWGPPCSTTDTIGAASADTIVFGSEVFNPGTITLGSGTPWLTTGNDTIDGSSAGVIVQCGASQPDAFDIHSNGNTIKGLEIYGCRIGVYIVTGQNNTVGGSTAAERNVISGGGTGVYIAYSGTDGNLVKGNYIGTNASGTAAVPNQLAGVVINQGAQNNTVEGNVISGTLHEGMLIGDSGTDGNVVKDNYIGTNAAGTGPIPNGEWGVGITDGAQNNTVEGNVISGNGTCGVGIGGSGADSNVVKGNYIGTDAAGTGAIPNGAQGVVISGGAWNNTVGGSTAGERNVISGNQWSGVEITAGANGNVIEGNYIGTNASGTGAIPNGGRGVFVAGGCQSNTIGGTASGEGNTIAFNTEAGVEVDGAGTTGNAIRGNSIHSNGGKGIELVNSGNEELPSPTITGFGSVLGTACANCAIDVYSDDEDEGRVYEGSTTADGDGDWSFPSSPEGPNITATATDSGGNTSEFSAPVAVPGPSPTPSPTASPTPSPTPGATRSVHWDPGWHNATWSGASTPEEAFACAAGNYTAAYRLVAGGWERYFPDRPDLSNMGSLEQYDAFLILVTGDVTCEMPVAAPPGGERTLDWGVGWQNDGWAGPDGIPPQDALACAAGSYAAAYRLVGGGWERYFPDRPDISNMSPLNHYDPFLILMTAPVSCKMPVAP